MTLGSDWLRIEAMVTRFCTIVVLVGAGACSLDRSGLDRSSFSGADAGRADVVVRDIGAESREAGADALVGVRSDLLQGAEVPSTRDLGPDLEGDVLAAGDEVSDDVVVRDADQESSRGPEVAATLDTGSPDDARDARRPDAGSLSREAGAEARADASPAPREAGPEARSCPSECHVGCNVGCGPGGQCVACPTCECSVESGVCHC